MSQCAVKGTLAGSTIEDSIQTAHLRRLIRIFNGCSVGSSRLKLRLWSDFVDALIDLNLHSICQL